MRSVYPSIAAAARSLEVALRATDTSYAAIRDRGSAADLPDAADVWMEMRRTAVATGGQASHLRRRSGTDAERRSSSWLEFLCLRVEAIAVLGCTKVVDQDCVEAEMELTAQLLSRLAAEPDQAGLDRLG